MNCVEKSIPTQLSVGEVSKRTGISVSAIHFYERKKLINSTRNQSNHRRYDRIVLRILAIIRFAQNVGISLNEIESALDSLPNKKQVTMKDWERLSRNWQKQLDARINQLIRLRNEITECIGCGCLSLEKCKMVNPCDSLGGKNGAANLLEKVD